MTLMANVTKGDKLTSAVLQPGWTIEDDGYGLLTVRANFIVSQDTEYGADGTTVISKAPKRGDFFENDPRVTCHRASSSVNKNGLQVITAEYCGIASGNMTTPEVSGRGATTTEPIATHPNFKSKLGGTKASPLNGAEFNDDGSFKAFASQTGQGLRKYGVKSYYSPTFSITGHFYTKDIEVAKKLVDSQCCSSADGQWKNIQLIGKLNSVATPVNPSWSRVPWLTPAEDPMLLLVGVNIQDYGSLFKVGFDVLVCVDGLDTEIYPYATLGWPKRDQT